MRGNEVTKRERIRIKFLEGIGWSIEDWKSRRLNGEEVGTKIEQISKDVQEHERKMNIKQSKFLRELREVTRKPGDKPKYLRGKKKKGEEN